MLPGGFLTSAFEESRATSACAAVYVTGAVLQFHLEINMHNTKVVKVEVNKIFSWWWICSHSINATSFSALLQHFAAPAREAAQGAIFFEARGDTPEKKARGWPWVAGLKICFGLLVVGMFPLFPEGCDQWWQGLVGSWSGEQRD